MLTSDFLLVKPEGSDRFVEFRDVFEVDGQAVRDRQDRLTKLFLDASKHIDQVRAIIDESARYNIGNIDRNVNTPMLSLLFLQKSYQERFRFKRSRADRPDLAALTLASRGEPTSFRIATEVWVIDFKETGRKTVIRTPDGRDFPAAGRFWIDPVTGAVLMSELVMEGTDVSATIDVNYQSEPLLRFRVPVEMRERYRAREDRIEGVATYGRFRQFQVRTDEEIAMPYKAPVKPPAHSPEAPSRREQVRSDPTVAEVSLERILARAADYVAAFQQQLSGIVAEESYLQEVRSARVVGPTRRALKSDFLLVRPERMDRYVEFRDVFDVDGQPVRDRQERLTKLFLDPSAADGPQMESIIRESARYNIGNVDRTLNTPMLSLGFLLGAYQPRFQFTRAVDRRPDVAARFEKTFRATPEMYVIEFSETMPETLIRTPSGADFPARGRFWIDPVTGAVLMTELLMSRADLIGIVNVSYQSEPLLGFRVPVAMRERYEAGGQRLEGTATYGRFRQFQVRTNEDIARPDQPLNQSPVKPPAKPPRGDGGDGVTGTVPA